MRKTRFDDDGGDLLSGSGVGSNARPEFLKVRRLVVALGHDDPRRVAQRGLEARPIGVGLVHEFFADSAQCPVTEKSRPVAKLRG